MFGSGESPKFIPIDKTDHDSTSKELLEKAKKITIEPANAVHIDTVSFTSHTPTGDYVNWLSRKARLYSLRKGAWDFKLVSMRTKLGSWGITGRVFLKQPDRVITHMLVTSYTCKCGVVVYDETLTNTSLFVIRKYIQLTLENEIPCNLVRLMGHESCDIGALVKDHMPVEGSQVTMKIYRLPLLECDRYRVASNVQSDLHYECVSTQGRVKEMLEALHSKIVGGASKPPSDDDLMAARASTLFSSDDD